MKHIGIVGGGIIGLSTAYYLNKAGFKVSVLDQGALQDGCSFGNAGMIVPSHFTPLAAPGMIARGIRWMFDSTSPFYVKPRIRLDLLRWGYEFYRHATRGKMELAIPALVEISLFSKSQYQIWVKSLPFDFGYRERGLLMLYQSAEAEQEETETAHRAHLAGLEAQVLTLAEVQRLEPDVRVSARGGVYYPGDAHLTPRALVEGLLGYLKGNGVGLHTSTTVTDFRKEAGVVRAARTSQGDFEADEWVMATGSWSSQLAATLGIRLPMQAGKGYSFTLHEVQKNTRIPSIFLDARVAVTPMGSDLRFGGTMEISGIDHSINMNRVKGIVDSIPRYYPDMKVGMPKAEEVWHGLRPCSPDGLPYIGRTRRWTNMIFATGHAMMGLSLGAGTGKLVSEIALGQSPSIPLRAFDPERYC